MPEMKKFSLRRLGPLVGLTLFVVALWVLHGELRHYSYHQVVEQFRSLPAGQVALAVLLTVVSYLLLTGYDTLGLQYARHRLPYRRMLILTGALVAVVLMVMITSASATRSCRKTGVPARVVAR